MATDTSKYTFNHTMLRVKDPEASLKYYNHLGMKLIYKKDFPENKFTLYFLAYDSPKAPSAGVPLSSRSGILELTHNHGSENDPNFKIANGNAEPHRGFGHICISVDNIQAACSRIEDAGYSFQKKLTDGRMRHIAFALDPDSYWVEIITPNKVEETENVTTTDIQTYKFNHSMLRVKDAEKSLKFYQDVMGMTLVRTAENPNAGFNLYFLAYADKPEEGTANMEGLLELTWNYGTEKQEGMVYHDGNAEPQGFGHICMSVDDVDAACKRFESLNVNWKKRLTDGRMRDIAFVLDPDGYWIEIIQSEKLKR